MIVILDSNIIISDYWMEKTSFKMLLLGIGKLNNISIKIPEVVIDEVINNYSMDLKRNIEELKKIEKTISKIVNDEKDINNHIDQSIKLINEKINKFNLNLKSIFSPDRRIGYPQISHKEVVAKIYKDEKPFKQQNKGHSESGYKDYLIWRSILEIVKEKKDEDFIFITNDSDFINLDNLELHRVLSNELKENGLELEKFDCFKDIDSFNNKYIKDRLNKRDDILKSIQQDKFEPFKSKNFVLNNWDVIKDDYHFHTYNDDMDEHIINFSPINKNDVYDVSELDEKHILISCNIYGFGIVKVNKPLSNLPFFQTSQINYPGYSPLNTGKVYIGDGGVTGPIFSNNDYPRMTSDIYSSSGYSGSSGSSGYRNINYLDDYSSKEIIKPIYIVMNVILKKQNDSASYILSSFEVIEAGIADKSYSDHFNNYNELMNENIKTNILMKKIINEPKK